ncbi:serendipity locus protein alpha [Drosophila albomicans]|uniref:Serendipity locus protein alpha n=1 Tax=Drosophila albomicans TaxID=7291 RepID=A0A6P8XS50_DROAB|nr:serendipity locus protein alpha [Drosophila albomicans]
MDKLFNQLRICTELIEEGSNGNISWLNEFCAAFHTFASKFKLYLPELAPRYDIDGNVKIHVETIFLCFTQVLTCITQLERIINIEENIGEDTRLFTTRSHFLNRIDWCVKRLNASLYQISEEVATSSQVKLEDLSFVELLDMSLDRLETYNEIVAENKEGDNEDATPDQPHDQLYSEVNQIVKHALAFANVALAADEKALREICETVLEECSVFQKNFDALNAGDRKLEALSLQRALYSLETYLNEALLRLILTSLLDVEEISITRLKNMLHHGEAPEVMINKLISDFDMNMDRIQQIGVIAIAFTEDVKTKTIVRSCLASMESLDSCIVPAFQLQTSSNGMQHADVLEHHFIEEIVIFRNVIHEIIDSRALISSYLDMLADSIHIADKNCPKDQLLKIAQMGDILYQHFQLKLNYQELSEDGQRLHQDFVAILRECQAVLELSTQIDPKRIIKRLKILHSVLTKLRDGFGRHEVLGSSCPNGNFSTVLNKTLSYSSRQKSSFARPRKDYILSKTRNIIPSDNESDLISFQLTEVLKIN